MDYNCSTNPHLFDFCVKKITIPVIAEEILQISEQIIEWRKNNNPKSVYNIAYKETQEGTTLRCIDEFLGPGYLGTIYHERNSCFKDCRDYLCHFSIPEKRGYMDLNINLYYNRDCKACYYVQSMNTYTSIKLSLIIIHNELISIAEKEGIEFKSHLYYNKFW